MPFMNETLSMDIMTRTRLRNKFLNDWSEGNKNKFLKERILVFHFWKNLNRTISKTRNIFMTKISMITKHLGKLLSDKVRPTKNMTLIDI